MNELLRAAVAALADPWGNTDARAKFRVLVEKLAPGAVAKAAATQQRKQVRAREVERWGQDPGLGEASGPEVLARVPPVDLAPLSDPHWLQWPVLLRPDHRHHGGIGYD